MGLRSFVFAILTRGMEQGDIRPDVDVEVVADMLGGPVVMRAPLTGDPITPRMVRKIVDTMLDDVAVRLGPDPEPHGPPERGRTTRVDLPAPFDDVGKT